MKKMKKSFMEELPQEILFDILSSRLSVKSLLRLRCVSTSLRKMIDDPRFAAMHLTHAYPKEPSEILLVDSLIFLYLVRREKDDDDGGDGRDLKTSLLTKFPRNRYGGCVSCNCNGLLCFVSHSNSCVSCNCNGLLCFVSHWSSIAFVLNPIKSEILMLSPIPSYSPGLSMMLVYGLGHDPSTNTYKVFRYYFLDKNNNIESSTTVEIQTLGTSSWRKISEKPPCFINGSPVFAYGALHWKPSCKTDKKMEGVLVSFDMAKEIFYSTPHPRFRYFHLVDLCGFLGIVDLSSRMQIEIWLLKNCCDTLNEKKKKREWVKEYTIDIKAYRNVKVLGMWGNDEILLEYNRLFTGGGSFSCYNLKSNELRDIPKLKVKKGKIGVYGYRESLVSLASFM